MSVIIVSVFLAYAAYKFMVLFNKTDTKTITNSYIEKVNYTSPDVV
jgi:hypothetical protein